ncbi:hypothetical protein [Methylomonas fluvii]|uniref:Uncharacterized protein n=1 Tax=Methylomonas fluvii TaxID=1854564 RepID=A0ABR9D7Y4_9GAMM|nr:hypothetical protein [Methylomonas fluvii]MBD9359224.1 hypothetical protein [Methylomonas fluvii]
MQNRKAKPVASPTKRLRPKRKYQDEVLLEPLKRIWFASHQLCGKRLKAAIPRWLPHYEDQYGILADNVRADLLKVSVVTLDRLLKPLRVQHPKSMFGTKPGSLLSSPEFPLALIIGTKPRPASSRPIRWLTVTIPWSEISSGG